MSTVIVWITILTHRAFFECVLSIGLFEFGFARTALVRLGTRRGVQTSLLIVARGSDSLAPELVDGCASPFLGHGDRIRLD